MHLMLILPICTAVAWPLGKPPVSCFGKLPRMTACLADEAGDGLKLRTASSVVSAASLEYVRIAECASNSCVSSALQVYCKSEMMQVRLEGNT